MKRLLPYVLGLLGCSGGSSSGAGGDGGAPALGSTNDGLEITASALSVEAGNELTFTAVATESKQEVIPTWSVTSGGAYIDEKGRLLAFEAGVVEVKGEFGGGTLSGTRQVNVTPPMGAWPGNVGYGGSDNEGGKAIAVDLQNNVYVAGAQARGLEGYTPALGGSDAFVARFLPNGKRAWTHTFVEPGPEFSSSLVAHPTDGVIVAYAYGGGSWLVHLDARGKERWKTVVSNASGNVVLADIALGKGGDVYATGSIDRVGDPFIGATDGIILHFDPQGQETWRKTFNHATTEGPPAFAADPTSIVVDEAQGRVAVTGIAQISYYYGASAFVRAFDLVPGSANEIWVKYVTTSGVVDAPPFGTQSVVADIALDAAIGKSGEIYAGGALYTTDIATNQPFLVRFNASGGVDWSKNDQTTPELVEQVGGGVSSLLYRPETNDLVAVTTAGDIHHRAGNYVSAIMTISDQGAVGWRRVPKAQSNALTANPNFSLRGITRDAAGLVYFVGDTAGDWGRPNPATAENLTGLDVAVGRVEGNGN